MKRKNPVVVKLTTNRQDVVGVIEPTFVKSTLDDKGTYGLFDGPTILDSKGNVRIIATKEPDEDLYII